jgi:hypothetical protein
MKLALVIPTYKMHYIFLKELCRNIAEQTRLPDLVIIRASSSDSVGTKFVLDLVLAESWPFPLKILDTPAQQYQAQNRNEGADAVPRDFDIISFFDSDDLMHPRRLEILEAMFLQGAEAALHGCTLHTMGSTIEWGTYDAVPRHVWDSILLQQESAVQSGNQIVSRSEVVKAYGASVTAIGKEITFLRPIPMDEELEEELQMTYGHASVSMKLFTALRFDETALGYEDVKYISDIVKQGYKTVSICANLSIYRVGSNLPVSMTTSNDSGYSE